MTLSEIDEIMSSLSTIESQSRSSYDNGFCDTDEETFWKEQAIVEKNHNKIREALELQRKIEEVLTISGRMRHNPIIYEFCKILLEQEKRP